MVLSPSQSQLSPLLLRLSGGSSSYVYSLMYRYICIDFGYLSVIVSSTGLIFSKGSQLNWLELVPIPHHREREHASLHFPPFVSRHLSPQHLISCLRSPVMSFHKPHVVARPSVKPYCGLITRSQALSIFGSQTRTEGQRLIMLVQPNCCIPDLLSTARQQNGSKLFTELGPFLTCSLEM